MGKHGIVAVATALLLSAGAPAARAVDGCLVLLCLAGDWSAISQCVPPVEQLFRELARGGAFPSCAFALVPSIPGMAPTSAPEFGAGAQQAGPISASRTPLTPGNCPAQLASNRGSRFSCGGYAGAVTILVGRVPWSRTLWSPSEKSLTCYSRAAKLALGLASATCSLP
jgi:hypothetical protein